MPALAEYLANPLSSLIKHLEDYSLTFSWLPPGKLLFVGDLVDSLYASRGTLDSKIEQAKLEIIKHYAVKFIRDNLYNYAVGNEIHYISTLLNKSASQLGIQPSLDNINMNEVTDELVADFISLVKEQLTPEIVAEQLVDNLQSQARGQFGIESDQYVIIDDSKYINAQKLLQEQYGDHWQMGHLLDTEGEIGTYRLQQNPTLLILSMLDYLQQKDMLDSSTEPALLATRPEKVDNSSSHKQTEIKLFRLGSLFWVEESVTKTYTIADNTEADRDESAPRRFQLTRPSSVASRRPLTLDDLLNVPSKVADAIVEPKADWAPPAWCYLLREIGPEDINKIPHEWLKHNDTFKHLLHAMGSQELVNWILQQEKSTSMLSNGLPGKQKDELIVSLLHIKDDSELEKIKVILSHLAFGGKELLNLIQNKRVSVDTFYQGQSIEKVNFFYDTISQVIEINSDDSLLKQLGELLFPALAGRINNLKMLYLQSSSQLSILRIKFIIALPISTMPEESQTHILLEMLLTNSLTLERMITDNNPENRDSIVDSSKLIDLYMQTIITLLQNSPLLINVINHIFSNNASPETHLLARLINTPYIKTSHLMIQRIEELFDKNLIQYNTFLLQLELNLPDKDNNLLFFAIRQGETKMVMLLLSCLQKTLPPALEINRKTTVINLLNSQSLYNSLYESLTQKELLITAEFVQFILTLWKDKKIDETTICHFINNIFTLHQKKTDIQAAPGLYLILLLLGKNNFTYIERTNFVETNPLKEIAENIETECQQLALEESQKKHKYLHILITN